MADTLFPHEAEILRSACYRCAESFNVSLSRAEDIIKGIKDTSQFLVPKYRAFGVFVPNEEEVTRKMTDKLLLRLEVLAKGLKEAIDQMEVHFQLFKGKYSSLQDLSTHVWQVDIVLPTLSHQLSTFQQATDRTQKFFSSLRYFSTSA